MASATSQSSFVGRLTKTKDMVSAAVLAMKRLDIMLGINKAQVNEILQARAEMLIRKCVNPQEDQSIIEREMSITASIEDLKRDAGKFS